MAKNIIDLTDATAFPSFCDNNPDLSCVNSEIFEFKNPADYARQTWNADWELKYIPLNPTGANQGLLTAFCEETYNSINFDEAQCAERDTTYIFCQKEYIHDNWWIDQNYNPH